VRSFVRAANPPAAAMDLAVASLSAATPQPMYAATTADSACSQMSWLNSGASPNSELNGAMKPQTAKIP
jgi:hypothetical protein